MTLSPLPKVMACRIEIEQVLLNLYKNAIEAMSAWPQRELRVSTRLSEAGYVLIAVSDTGKGLLLNEMANLFNPFQTTKKDGLGLGLVICRSIVENHGGQIWADANMSLGAEFCFTLPAGAEHE
jgi:two-component system sensor kinase FixL